MNECSAVKGRISSLLTCGGLTASAALRGMRPSATACFRALCSELRKGATFSYLEGLWGAQPVHSPATCLVEALRRFQRLAVAIERIRAASACSS